MENKTTLNKLLSNSNFCRDKSIRPFSELWCKEKKIEILRRLPGVFKDMDKIKNKDYLTSDAEFKPFSLNSLKGIPGIYMITNKITKKYYIGMSTDLKNRLEGYLNLNRLMRNRSSRIHKALIKYGAENFSITILQLDMDRKNTSSTF